MNSFFVPRLKKEAYKDNPNNFDIFGQAYEPLKSCSLPCALYIISLVSLLAHLVVMWLLMDAWCNSSKLVIGYSF